MKTFFQFCFFFALVLTWFRLVEYTDALTKEISISILFFSFIPILFTLIPYAVYLRLNKFLIKKEKEVIELKERLAIYREEDEEQEKYETEEGEIMCLIDVPSSNQGGKYSEGVFLWFEKGQWLTDIEFHISRGGDPDVFNRWLDQEKENPRYLKSTLQ